MSYKDSYYSIINNRLLNPLHSSEYSERHHIVPKSICPLLSKSNKNIIRLTAEEHFKVHYYLWKWFDEIGEKQWCRKMCFAFNQMKRVIPNCNNEVDLSELYSEVRQSISNYISEMNKGRLVGNKNPNYGKKMPMERKVKLSINNGSHRQEVRNKISETRRQRKCGTGNRNAVGGKGHTGLKWITNNLQEKAIPIGVNPPYGWRFGRMKKGGR